MCATMEVPGRPYWGNVIGTLPDRSISGQVVWRVQIKTPGDYFGRKAKVDRNNVPKGINTGMDVQFDLTTGRYGELIAVNAAYYVR